MMRHQKHVPMTQQLSFELCLATSSPVKLPTSFLSPSSRFMLSGDWKQTPLGGPEVMDIDAMRAGYVTEIACWCLDDLNQGRPECSESKGKKTLMYKPQS
jgi:hypothetical protein